MRAVCGFFLVVLATCGPAQSPRSNPSDDLVGDTEPAIALPQCGGGGFVDRPVGDGWQNVGTPPWAMLRFVPADLPNTLLTVETMAGQAGMGIQLNPAPSDSQTPVTIRIHIQRCGLTPPVKFILPSGSYPPDSTARGWAEITRPWEDLEFGITVRSGSGFVILSN